MEKKGYLWSQSPWAARGHFMGSPNTFVYTPLTARGCKSMSPRKLLGESDLNKEIQTPKELSYRKQMGETTRSRIFETTVFVKLFRKLWWHRGCLAWAGAKIHPQQVTPFP